MSRRVLNASTAMLAGLAVVLALMWLRSFDRSTCLYWASAPDASLSRVSQVVGVSWSAGELDFGQMGWSAGPGRGWHGWDSKGEWRPNFLPWSAPGWAGAGISGLAALLLWKRLRVSRPTAPLIAGGGDPAAK